MTPKESKNEETQRRQSSHIRNPADRAPGKIELVGTLTWKQHHPNRSSVLAQGVHHGILGGIVELAGTDTVRRVGLFPPERPAEALRLWN